MTQDNRDNMPNIANMTLGKSLDYMRIMSNNADFMNSELAVKARKLLSQGLANKAVADLLNIELATVDRIIFLL